MLKIAITQRREVVVGRDEHRDCLDTRLCGLLWDLGFLPLPLVSGLRESKDYLAAIDPDGLILSGGNDIGSCAARDDFEGIVLDYAIAHNLPVLGICRGMQYLNYFMGGALHPVDNHKATRHLVNGPLLDSKDRQVNSYHNHGLKKADLGSNLEAVALSEDGVVEALRHNTYPWLGIMWHPERDNHLDQSDLTIIRKHFQRPT
jgi:gamma-glutamyl-gamma-aminobutyrate hydrolase PuuD